LNLLPGKKMKTNYCPGLELIEKPIF